MWNGAEPPNIPTARCLVGLLVLLALPSVAFGADGSNGAEGSQTGGVEVELRIGGGWNFLSSPADQRGDPTLMSGASFSGASAIGGLALRYVWPAGDPSDNSQPNSNRPKWVTELDVLYGRHRAVATEPDRDSRARRRAVMHVGLLHIPVLFGYRFPLPAGSDQQWQLAAGPVLLHGLNADLDVEIDGGTGQTTGLGTADTTHLGATAQLASAIPVGDIRIPLEARALWNPTVGRTTLDRLRNYNGPDAPGALEANFDWQLLFLTGARF